MDEALRLSSSLVCADQHLLPIRLIRDLPTTFISRYRYRWKSCRPPYLNKVSKRDKCNSGFVSQKKPVINECPHNLDCNLLHNGPPLIKTKQ